MSRTNREVYHTSGYHSRFEAQEKTWGSTGYEPNVVLKPCRLRCCSADAVLKVKTEAKVVISLLKKRPSGSKRESWRSRGSCGGAGAGAGGAPAGAGQGGP